MGRFSCFYGHLHGQKQKKPLQSSFDTMIKMLQVGSQNHAPANLINSTTLHKLPMVDNEDSNLNNDTEHATLSTRGWKSGELKCEHQAESYTDSVLFEMGNFKRSLSAGCELDQKGRVFGDDYIDQEFSCNGSHDCKEITEFSAANEPKSSGTTLSDQDQEAHLSLSPHLSSDLVNHKSVFSVGDSLHFDKEGHDDSDVPSHTDHADNTGGGTNPPSMMSKCYSMPNFNSSSPNSPELYPDTQSRSYEDLSMLVIKKEDASAPDANTQEITQLNKDDSCCKSEKFEGENTLLDHYDSYNYACSSKDWIVPGTNEIEIMNFHQGESSSQHWDHLPNMDFKIKRIEDWVGDLQHCSPVEETDEQADSYNEEKRGSTILNGLDAAKVDTKINPGMEAAKRYISSLNPAAATAQLANHGLVVIPFLSAFVGLKALNLSGNSIVRITAGALPRGLHMLNLSKNKISTIEGLRELTRLRFLDLSYNKISRIGHGLASCSSIKELYLAGNKISEVEGLHRLLKLSVLDLRFNKIATSKSLGQLAANYNSLQAISLEGNPAQKNVGDEQLKKYLQGLLPHLAYYNRQHIKNSTLKDTSDRSVRLGISAHQFDRGLRSDHKSSSRRGSHGSATIKRSSHSSTHGQKGPATDLAKQSRKGHGLVPPSGSRSSHHHHHQFDMGNNKIIQSLRAGSSMHKSRSEGTLAAF